MYFLNTYILCVAIHAILFVSGAVASLLLDIPLPITTTGPKGYRPTCIINCSLNLCIVAYASYLGWTGLFLDRAYNNGYIIPHVLSGYFLYDFSTMLVGKKIGMVTCIHHIGSFILFYFAQIYDLSHYVCAMGGIGEISTIFLDIMNLMNYCNIDGTTLLVVKGLFAISFIGIRMMYWPVLYWWWFRHDRPPLEYPVVNMVVCVMVGLQFMWGWRIVRKMFNTCATINDKHKTIIQGKKIK